MKAGVPLKRARDSVSSLVAQMVRTVPVLQRPYAVAAFACSHVPGVHTVFREATRNLSRQLRDSGQNIRPVRIGAVRMLFDVTDFTVQGRYFSRVAYEPGATATVLSASGSHDLQSRRAARPRSRNKVRFSCGSLPGSPTAS